MTASSSNSGFSFPWGWFLGLIIAFAIGIFVFLNWEDWMTDRATARATRLQQELVVEQRQNAIDALRARSVVPADIGGPATDPSDDDVPTMDTINERRQALCAQPGSNCRNTASRGGVEQGQGFRESGGFEERGGVQAAPTQYVRFEEELSADLRCVRIDFPNLRRSEATPDEVRRAAALTMSKICQPAEGQEPWPMTGTMPEAPYLNYHATPRRAAPRQ